MASTLNNTNIHTVGELAPAQYRGRMIAFNNMSITLG